MPARVVTILLAAGFMLGSMLLAGRLGDVHLPGNRQDYEPSQPVAFSHRLHAGELQISCHYCHQGAEQGRHAGIPALSTCMKCHKAVTAPMGSVRAEETAAKAEGRPARPVVSPELRKLYDALALDEALAPVSGKAPEALAWTRVHNLPSFVSFDHRAHVGAGVDCRVCHGAVENMERVRQVESLSMGWCVNCHRETARTGVQGKAVKPSLDCVACHQ